MFGIGLWELVVVGLITAFLALVIAASIKILFGKRRD